MEVPKNKQTFKALSDEKKLVKNSKHFLVLNGSTGFLVNDMKSRLHEKDQDLSFS